jgi:Xaa-Pro aminopeptidase
MIDKIACLREKLGQQNIDALLITRQTNIRYLTGYSGEDAYLLLFAQQEAAFITDFRNLDQAEQEAKDKELCFARLSISEPLEKIVSDYCLRYNCRNLAIEKDHISYALYEKLVQSLPKISLLPLDDMVGGLREIKNQEELSYLLKAGAIADAAFERLLHDIVPGIRERQLAANLEYYMLCLDAEAPAFATIVASGANGSQCHACPTDKEVQKGDFITIDFGAKYKGYCSDCTRTLILGQPSPRQKEIYEIVLSVKNTVQPMVKAGAFGKIIHLEAARLLQVAGLGQYFGHGLGHGIGLDVHEQPRLSQNSHSILKVGNAVTVEPGVYIRNWGGIRIEDSLIIGETENMLLSKLSTELICL